MQYQSAIRLESEPEILLPCGVPNEGLMDIVLSYLDAKTADDRIARASFIFDQIEPELRLFIMGKAHPNEAEDILQESFKAIILKLASFRGGTVRAFWKWCYQIARNKMVDQYHASVRVQSLQKEEFAQLIRLSARAETLSAEDRFDLKFALGLLEKSKPGCRDLLWKRFVIGFTHEEIAEEFDLKCDAVRMRVNRCLDAARGILGD